MKERHERWVNKLRNIVPKKTLDDFKTIDDIQRIEDCLNLKVDHKYQYKDWKECNIF